MVPRIRELLRATPFRPFTIRTSDGREYFVSTANHAAVNPNGTRVIAFSDDDRQAEVGASDVAAVNLAELNLLENLAAEVQAYEKAWPQMFADRFDIVLRVLAKGHEVLRARIGRPGQKAMSIDFEHALLRWHNSRYLWTGKDIYKSFTDGEWKLEAKGRFAGKSLNSGHYFALTPIGATAERLTYPMSANDVLLCGDTVLTNILDLTNSDNVEKVFCSLVAKGRIIDCGILRQPWEMLYELMNAGVGGNWITDYVGRWAAEEGYAGILFFSSRAAALYRDNHFKNRNGSLADITFTENMLTVRSDRNTYCVVVFSGATFLNGCRRVTVKRMNLDEETFANPYFDKGEDTIRKLFAADFGEILGRVAFIHPTEEDEETTPGVE